MTDKYAVLGNPIQHSLSPELHAAFANQTGEEITYDKIRIEIGHFSDQLSDLIASGYRGFNVTVPFKEEAYRWVDEPAPDTAFAGALNTLLISPGVTKGFSTDGVGLIRDLTQNHSLNLKGKRLLLLGAGGAAKSVIPSLIDTGASELVVANRTLSKVQQLAKKLPLTPCDLQSLSGHFDLVINATSASLSGNRLVLPEGLINETSFCYDMMYGQGETPFLFWGKEHGARAVDGLGMLVEQGAESFYLWRGVRPKTKDIFHQLSK